MNYHVFFFLTLLFSFIPDVRADGNHFTLTQAEDICYEEPSAFTVFYIPIKFTRTGIRCFLKHAFNRPEYATEFLPYNFTHVLQFLEHGNKAKQSVEYMESIIRLFYNKLKATHFLTSYALHELLEPLPNLLQTHCSPVEIQTIFTQLKTNLYDLLYKTFLESFSLFKKNPDGFFDNLSEQILDEMNETTEKSVSHEQFRQSILRFLEIAFNKVIWCPSDGAGTWKSVKLFSHQLEKLHQADILDEYDLDDLYKSLIERFCYYLNVNGTGISLETIEMIRKEIASKKLHFLELAEQERYLEPKSKRLERALLIAEAKAHARTQGMVV